MKICVYAICKNELQFVDRFMESIGSYADVYIGDTGSTDGTIEAFRKYKNCTVFEYKIDPWRFDKARQTCLEMIGPKYDLYFSLDVDEVIITKDWKKLVEKACKGKEKEINQVFYTFEPYFDENGKPTSTFMNNRFHSFDFHWVYPIHEVISAKPGIVPVTVSIKDLVVHHFPDPNKTSNQCYLPLLVMAEQEMPDDARIAHYLGREYLYAGQLDDAIRTLEKHTTMPSSIWRSEISCSMRLIAEAYMRKNMDEHAEFWFMKACIESVNERESYIDLAKYYYRKQMWRQCLTAALNAHRIKEKTYDHYSCNHYSWYGGPEDMMCISYYNLGQIDLAYHFAKEAARIDPSCKRYHDNVIAIENTIRDIQNRQQVNQV